MFERHTQTALVGLAVLLLGWVGFTVSSNDKTLAVLSSEVSNIKQQLGEASKDRFTGAEGARMYLRIEKLERQFTEHIRNHPNGRDK